MLQSVLSCYLPLAAVIAIKPKPYDATTPLCREFGFKLEVWSAFPPVLVVRKAISGRDAEEIRVRARPALKPSATFGDATGKSVRTSSSTFFAWRRHHNDALFTRLQRRIFELFECVDSVAANWSRGAQEALQKVRSSWPSSLHSEDLQVARYAPGEYYFTHVDESFGREDLRATLLLYLSESGGGETVFPNLRPPGNSLEEKLIEGSRLSEVAKTESDAYDDALWNLVDAAGSSQHPWRNNLTVQQQSFFRRACAPDPTRCSENEFLDLQDWEMADGTAPAGLEFCCCSDTLRIRPDRGTAVLFFPGSVLDQFFLFHGACPVTTGAPDKWVLQQWFNVPSYPGLVQTFAESSRKLWQWLVDRAVGTSTLEQKNDL